ncbi:MAG: FAD-binding protein [Parasphingopyxis sp.]|nr:FAD-binding protein [Sphingomonadales bacterium]
MPIVKLQQSGDWSNYHKTGDAALAGRFAVRSSERPSGRRDLALVARELRSWLRAARQSGVSVRPVGGAWSPSNIQLVHQGWMLNTRRFNRMFRIAAEDLAASSSFDPASLVLIEAGTQIDEINDKLEREMGRSLRSTGASNGQTIAGACATGTHGAVLTAGGIQDHVRAIQIVTPAKIYWIEPDSGVMDPAFVDATGSTLIRDDEVFAAALVHVGSLGLVTAYVLETVPLYLVRPIMKLIDFRRADLEMLGRGDFRAFSAAHALDRAPYFVMVITNPHNPFGRKAIVRFLYKEPYELVAPGGTGKQMGAGYDAFTLLGWIFRNLPLAYGMLTELIMKLGVGNGTDVDDPPVYGSWGATTETHRPMADLFTGAVFCDRAELVRVFDLLCRKFTRAGGRTVVTLRFMKGGSGLLAPARWDDTAGLDCDGPRTDRTTAAFCKVLESLEVEGIDFTRHWGKFNSLDANRVAHDYGGDLTRWKSVRNRLLPKPQDRALFRSAELDRLGLTL